MADSEAVPVATEDAPKLVGEALQAAVAQEPPKPPAPPAVEGVAEPAVEGATQAGANTPPSEAEEPSNKQLGLDAIASGVHAAKSKPKLTHPENKERLLLNLGKMAQGDHALEGGDFITTARAQNEVAITVRGAAKARAKLLMKLTQKELGTSNVRASWQNGGAQIAIASEVDGNCVLALYGRKGEKLKLHNLGAGRPSWCDWDCTGNCLAVMQVHT